MKQILRHPFFIRLRHWEYWPFHIVYAPIYPIWLWYCLKARSFFFFNAANPSIENGGFLLESKKRIYGILPKGSYPDTCYFPAGTPFAEVEQVLQKAGMDYPLVGKPDIGMRGMGVSVLKNPEALADYIMNSRVPYLVQSWIPYEEEIGVFYCRIPGESKGRITGIVGKEFLSVTGDGRSTIRELLEKNERAILQAAILSRSVQSDQIPAHGEKIVLVPYGNHARGAKFLDLSRMSDAGLERVINEVCTNIKGFYYGRLDIRFASWEDLRAGRHFSIIELNGAGSEPTHIYDPSHNIFFAWKEIIRHWSILCHISRENHRRFNLPYMHWREGVKMLRKNRLYVAFLNQGPSM